MKHIAVILLFFFPLFAFSQSKQSDEYYNKGVELYNKGKYKEAIPYFEQSAELDFQEMEEGDPRREYSSHWLSACYYKLGNISKAETIYPGEYMVPPVDRRLTLESDRMSVLAMAAMDNGDYQTAADYYLKMMTIEKQVEGENHPWVANDYYYYGLCLVNLGDYATAEIYMKQYADIYKKTYGSKSLQYAGAIVELAELYSIKRKDKESVIYGKKVLEIYAAQLGKDNDDYLLSLSNTARYCNNAELYQEALRYQKALMSRIKPSEMEPSDYITCVNNLALYNQNCGYFQEALKQYDISLQTAENNFGKNSEEYISVLSDIACVYGTIGNSLKEIEIENEVLKVAEEKFNSEYVHIKALVRLSESWMAIGALLEAKDPILKAYDIMNEKSYDKLSDEYLTVLSDLIELYAIEKDRQSVLKYCDEKRGIHAQMFGEDSYDYLISEIDYALALGDLGDYDNAISMLEKNYGLMRKAGHKIAPSLLANLADMYHSKGDLNKTKDNYETAIQIAYADKDTIEYVRTCSDLALVQLERGDLNSALSFFTDSAIISDFMNNQHISADNMSHFGTAIAVFSNFATVASAVLTLANLPDELKPPYKSFIQLVDSMTLYYNRTFKGENSFDYMDCVFNVAYDKLMDGDYDFVNKNIPLWFDWIIKYIRNNFSTMTAQERFNFQQMHINKLDQSLLLSSFKTHSPKLTGIAYDGQLFVKGLSLNAEIEIQKLIEKNGDMRMKELYYKIRNDRGLLDKLYQMPKNKRTINTDSLQNEIEKAEKALVASSKDLGDYTKNLSISWQNVQNKLKDTDIAIEFGQFYESGRLFLVALVLKKGMSNPEIVELFKGQNIDSVLNTNIYTTPALYNSIWKPLQKYLTNVKNVYFSPSGKFHTIAIEYLPDENGEIFAKKYNVYRLSSTRDLALHYERPNPNKKAAVYGGIRYDLGKEDWNDRKDKEYQDYAAELSAFRDVPIIDNKNLRSGAAYLKGTELEAQAIIPILRNNGYQVSENTDVFATEESFKKLSGSGIKILHIGTHGFYKEEDPAHQEILGLSADRQSKEDLSLSRSGLLLAGANSTLDPDRRNDIPEGMDDGILTAKEISRLDFKGLDLVVLSACQTGLGEVTSEGVFGLQRGFKKAGAQTIVMSLWSVDDNATQLLMTEFFKNLASGLSKREAFLSAQNTVKEKYPAPKYWAAFVMVDGIDN